MSGGEVTALTDREMRRSSGFMPRMKTSMVAPTETTAATFSTRSSANSETCTRPSTPGATSTKAPKSAMRATVPWTIWPALWVLMKVASGSPLSCLIPSDARWLDASIDRTTTSTSCPSSKRVEGSGERCSQDRSLTCTSPSIPGATSTKIPKSVIERTGPFRRVPAGMDAPTSAHGSGSARLRLKLRRRLVTSTSSTTASTCSP